MCKVVRSADGQLDVEYIFPWELKPPYYVPFPGKSLPDIAAKKKWTFLEMSYMASRALELQLSKYALRETMEGYLTKRQIGNVENIYVEREAKKITAFVADLLLDGEPFRIRYSVARGSDEDMLFTRDGKEYFVGVVFDTPGAGLKGQDIALDGTEVETAYLREVLDYVFGRASIDDTDKTVLDMDGRMRIYVKANERIKGDNVRMARLSDLVNNDISAAFCDWQNALSSGLSERYGFGKTAQYLTKVVAHDFNNHLCVYTLCAGLINRPSVETVFELPEAASTIERFMNITDSILKGFSSPARAQAFYRTQVKMGVAAEAHDASVRSAGGKEITEKGKYTLLSGNVPVTMYTKAVCDFLADMREQFRINREALKLYHEKIVMPLFLERTEDYYRRETETLTDAVKISAGTEDKRPLVIAFSKDWIRGAAEGEALRYAALRPVIQSLRGYCGRNGITFIEACDGSELLKRVEDERKNAPRSRIVLLADAQDVRSVPFSQLRGDSNIVMAGVEKAKLKESNYVRLLEMLRIMVQLSLVSPELRQQVDLYPYSKTHLHVLRDALYPQVFVFIPEAEPMEYEQLRQIYRLQVFA